MSVNGDEVSSCLRLVTSCLSLSSPTAVSSYMSLLRSWFKMSLTRQQFDKEARSLLPPAAIPLHNTFLLAILDRVYGLARHHDNILQSSHQSSGPHTSGNGDTDMENDRDNSVLSKQGYKERRTVYSAPSLCDLLQQDQEHDTADQDANKKECKWTSTEIFLPDQPLVTGRLLVAAWETGLDGADDSAAELIVMAVQVFLKNILSVVLSQRKGYKVRDKNFVHSIGCDVPNPWLRNAPQQTCGSSENVKFDEDNEEKLNPLPTVDDMECATAYDIACGVPKSTRIERRVSLHDVYDALKIHKNVIASHSVYAVNMERIASLLNHPGY